MKRVLVVDESRAVRETIALILGRDFVVTQRSPAPDENPFHPAEEIHLLILGISPQMTRDPASLTRAASELLFPVLFLVDSRSWVELRNESGKVDFLAKPFYPYQLRESVERLLFKTRSTAQSSREPIERASAGATRYLDYPYVPRATSVLARRFARTPFSIMILSEAGCGQERMARALHDLSETAGSFIAVYPPNVTAEYLAERTAQLPLRPGQRFTLFLSGVEALKPAEQASLLAFLEEEEERGRQFRFLSSSSVSLLERVHRGEFLSPLYYRLATLTLRVPPLRDRIEDLPALAGSIAQECAARLGLGTVSFSETALDRLRNYLWFGNLAELEAVIARTLAVHRNSTIDAPDLILGGEEIVPPAEEQDGVAAEPAPLRAPAKVDSDSPVMRLLIGELAHELKNPMVAIKTFAQLLEERFDDPAFREQFRETVAADIDRMDELLEALLDFSNFNHPHPQWTSIQELLQRVLDELSKECAKRALEIRRGAGEEPGSRVFADEDQIRFALKSTLRAVLDQAKPGTEVRVDTGPGGDISVFYFREAGPARPLDYYFDLDSARQENEALPLRMLLARILLEKNGGGLEMRHRGGGKMQVRIEIPAASRG